MRFTDIFILKILKGGYSVSHVFERITIFLITYPKQLSYKTCIGYAYPGNVKQHDIIDISGN